MTLIIEDTGVFYGSGSCKLVHQVSISHDEQIATQMVRKQETFVTQKYTVLKESVEGVTCP